METSSKAYLDEQPKLQAIPGGTPSSVTFVITHEDHTLGNALRYVLMRDRATDFCGYSMPHPSEPVVNLRLQTRGGAPAIDVFRSGLRALIDVCQHVGEAVDAAEAPQGGGGGDGGSGGGGGCRRRAASPLRLAAAARAGGGGAACGGRP